MNYSAHTVKAMDGFAAVVIPENGEVTWRGDKVHETEQEAIAEGEQHIEGLDG